MQVKFAGVIPHRASAEAAGLDLIADIAKERAIMLKPGERILVPTGTYMELPVGYVGLITPRSGNAVRNGLSVVNTPGIIDSDYRGQLQVALINHGDKAITIGDGERIAQLVILQQPDIEIVPARMSDFSVTRRGTGGFGSTGK